MDSPPLLRATFFLDHQPPSIRALVERATAGAASETERAARIFRAVRDGVRYDPYRIDASREGMTASATLARGRGFCVTKAILLAAALRAAGIPARLGFCDVTNHLATPRLLELMGTDVFAFHGYVELHLGGRVLKATPAFHASLCAHFGVPPLELDGEHDALLQACDGSGRAFMRYLRERGVYDDFPYGEFLRVWRETYPRLAAEYGLPGGDFEAEATARS